MRIAHIIPGSGGKFYCQNCLRDLSLVQGLRAAGHESVIVPMYLPLLEGRRVDTPAPVFFGAVNVYLAQVCALFRHTPRWLDRWLDTRALLELIARKAAATRAKGLEKMTLSMLRGQEGNQAKELRRLLDWLESDLRPEVVHLSNALLLGLAPELRRRLRVPVVCSLQDEDVWVEAMNPEYIPQMYRVMAEQARHVDAFIAVSRYYADFMRPRLCLPPQRLHVIPPGLALKGYEPAALPLAGPVLGFLSRLSRPLGLETLVEAFCLLRRDARFSDLRLHLAGGMTGDDGAFVDELLKRLADAGCAEAVRIFPSETLQQRQEFLRTLTVLSVPVPAGEAFGMFIIEANACGVPVVQPDAGAFAEIVGQTGGGRIYSPNTPEALAEELRALLLSPERLHALGAAGREAVRGRFSLESVVARTEDIYRGLCEKKMDGEKNAPLLELAGINKAYADAGDQPPVLRGLSLSVEAGQTVAICGPSGSGKSTLLNLIGALDQPDDGMVRLGGQPLTELAEDELAALRGREIGFVFQLHHLLPQLTVLENVLLPTLALGGRADAAACERAHALLARVGLAQRAGYLPGQLSGGERQRAAVVRALINRPRLLLADEPTGSLDHSNARELVDMLCMLNAGEGVSVIMVTHDEELAGRMQVRYRLREGALERI